MENKLCPILDFIDEKSLTNPEATTKGYKKIGKNLIFTFFKDVIDELMFEKEIDYCITLYGENSYTIYKFVNYDIYIVHGIIGCPASGAMLEELISLGVQNVIFAGGGGSLISTQEVGKLVLVNSAIRDEGLSYHYFPAGEEITAEPQYLEKFSLFLKENKVPFCEGKTWTTDAFYRETPTMIQKRLKQGAIIVEMEQSGLMAIAKFRNINYAGLIYCGDDISGDAWDCRGWGSRKDVRRSMVEAIKEFFINETKF